MLLWWICITMLLNILCGARRELLCRGQVVLILTMVRVKPIWRNRTLSDINRSFLGRIILADTGALNPTVVKVFLTIWDCGDDLRTLKQTLRGLLSPLHSTSTLSGSVALTVRTTTLGTKLRNDYRPTRSTDVVIHVLVSIVVKSVTCLMNVLSQSRDSSRVL